MVARVPHPALHRLYRLDVMPDAQGYATKSARGNGLCGDTLLGAAPVTLYGWPLFPPGTMPIVYGSDVVHVK